MKKYISIFAILLVNTSLLLGILFFIGEIKDSKPIIKKPILEGNVLAETSQITLEEEEEYSSIQICIKEVCKEIPSDVVKKFVTEKLTKEEMTLYILENISTYFENLYGGKSRVKNINGEFISWNKDIVPDSSHLYENIFTLLKDVKDGRIPGKYEIPLKDIAGTDGKYAKKYIEVDNSKQKLYVWEDAVVTKEIFLSGPKYGFQVYGVFPIVDKGLAPIAPGGKYMPYWMAFYHSLRQDSWYGLHGLIWWYGEDGKKVAESLENIGKRKSAGCIRMLKEDAKFLYEKFEKGDLVLIHE